MPLHDADRIAFVLDGRGVVNELCFRRVRETDMSRASSGISLFHTSLGFVVLVSLINHALEELGMLCSG